MIVADTGALYALYDGDDANHRKVANCLRKQRQPIIVPVVILAELDYLLREFLGVDAELAFMAALESGYYVLESFTEADLKRCAELLRSYRDLDIGLADAAVVATAERLRTKHVLTVDERHFRAIKPKFGPLVLLPSDG